MVLLRTSPAFSFLLLTLVIHYFEGTETSSTASQSQNPSVVSVQPVQQRRTAKDETSTSSIQQTASQQLQTTTTQVTTTTTTTAAPAPANQQQVQSKSPSRRKNASNGGNSNNAPAAPCEYEKGTWEQCDSNGLQKRTLKLKVGSQQQASGSKCEPIKIIQRECKVAGCKYLRGEWSATCVDGRRTRIDKLVSRVGPSGGTTTTEFACQPQRRVTKDCKRTCHYSKSAWSECSNGFRTRNLTLTELSGDPLAVAASNGCAKVKQLKRECRTTSASQQTTSTATAPQHPTTQQQPATTTTKTTTTTSSPRTLSSSASASASAVATNNAGNKQLTAAQRRRLKQAQKQEQRREQQKQQQLAKQQQQSSNENIKSTGAGSSSKTLAASNEGGTGASK